ncbi:MAG TPA: FtsQ-type POTRA domain-containing protein [Candidatus Dormibacteraeota bacterium]
MKPRRRRASRFPRPDFRWVHPAPAARLAGQTWAQSNAVTEKEEGTPRWRGLAAMLAAVELLVALFLAAGPLFQVREVDVQGSQRLGAAQVRTLAGLDRPGSVFAVDAATIRRKLTATAWVREATVTTELPDRVVVSVQEWQPVAAYRAGAQGKPYFLSDRGVVLGPAANTSAVVDVQGPAGPDPKVGQQPLEVTLLTALVNIQRQLPALVGQSVGSFQLDGCGNLTMVTGKAWKVLFGRVITPEEIAALKDKLAALKSIAADVNFNSPDLDYVNLMNPSEPAVKLKSAKPPPTPTPAPAPRPQPSPSVSPVLQPVLSCA